MSRALLIAVIVLVAIGVMLWSTLRRRDRAPGEPRLAPKAAGSAQLAAPVAAAPPPAAATDPAVRPQLFGRLYALAQDDPRGGELDVKPDPAHMQVLLAASRAIAQIGTEPTYTPRRPSLLPQLLETVNDEEASLRALSRIISQDPELTSELLRTANSPLYRVSSAPIESIERASALVGTQGIRTLITAALMRPLATQDGSQGRFSEVIWEHSLYSATGAEALAARSQDCDPYIAHLLGLLQGLGSVAVYRAVLDQYAAHPQMQPDAAAISQSLGAQAGVTARRIAANWGLSEKTQEALEAQSSAAPAGDVGPLGRALAFGRAAGALILLCRRGELSAEECRDRLAAMGYASPQIDRIWDRMVKAYVNP